jgi:hypothetical protein
VSKASKREEYEIRLNRDYCYRIEKSIGLLSEVQYEEGCACAVVDAGRCLAARVRVRSGEVSTVKYSIDSTEIAPGFTYHHSIEVDVTNRMSGRVLANTDLPSRFFVRASRGRVRLGSWEIRVTHYEPDGIPAGEIEYLATGKPSPAEILELLRIVHASYVYPPSMEGFLGQYYLSELRQVSSAVVDIREPPEGDVIYRVKVDGEGVWLIDGGAVWYICRPGKKLAVAGWVFKSVVGTWSRRCTVIRAEQLCDGSLVYISVLSVSGEIVPRRRSYESPAHELAEVANCPEMIIREDYNCFHEALEASRRRDLPNDGVIAIDRTNCLTHRIKEPTVDLQCQGGLLVSGRGASMKWVTKAVPGMIEGYVYECRIAIEEGTEGEDVPTVLHYIHRPDKEHPNSTYVATVIMLMLKSSSFFDLVLERRVTSFCFDVRAYLYELAANSRSTGQLVVDVGSGRMQSRSYLLGADRSYVLCDPEFNPRHLKGCIGTIDLKSISHDSLLPTLEMLNKGKLKIGFFKGGILDFVRKVGVLDWLISRGVPFVYSFSLSHVLKEFKALGRRNAVQIAAAYVYDDVDESGVLMSIGGIDMRLKLRSTKEAIVKFPLSDEFSETAIRSEHFRGFTVTRVSECIPSFHDCEWNVKRVVKHIRIVVSEK